jgi:hypothetical protein
VPSLADNNDSSPSPPLLELLERFPDLFLKEVLERLDPTTRAPLAGAGSAFLEVVFPRSIFPFGLPTRAYITGGEARVFKLGDFLGSAERLAWARANGCPWNRRTCQLAAARGKLEALQWMREQNCPWISYSFGVCEAAAMGGHLAVLRWAREHDCPLAEATCYFAAARGHLAALQWARAHGCPWRKLECEDASEDHPETLAWVQQQPLSDIELLEEG